MPNGELEKIIALNLVKFNDVQRYFAKGEEHSTAVARATALTNLYLLTIPLLNIAQYNSSWI